MINHTDMTPEEHLVATINEMLGTLEGNAPVLENGGLEGRSDYDTVVKCIKEALGGALSLASIKGIVDMVKEGAWAAAVAKLAASVGGKILGVAGAAAFLLTCGAQDVG